MSYHSKAFAIFSSIVDTSCNKSSLISTSKPSSLMVSLLFGFESTLTDSTFDDSCNPEPTECLRLTFTSEITESSLPFNWMF